MGAVVGAVAGLLIGIWLSVYVARLDQAKYESGVRTKRLFRLSLFGVPVILAIVGALVGGAIAR